MSTPSAPFRRRCDMTKRGHLSPLGLPELARLTTESWCPRPSPCECRDSAPRRSSAPHSGPSQSAYAKARLRGGQEATPGQWDPSLSLDQRLGVHPVSAAPLCLLRWFKLGLCHLAKRPPGIIKACLSKVSSVGFTAGGILCLFSLGFIVGTATRWGWGGVHPRRPTAPQLTLRGGILQTKGNFRLQALSFHDLRAVMEEAERLGEDLPTTIKVTSPPHCSKSPLW